MKLTLGPGVDEHSGVHAFNGDEIFSAMLVFVLVSEDNFGEGSTTTSVVDNVSHDTLDIPTAKLETGSISRVVARFRLSKLTQLFRRSRGF